jgi:hypothetical protein
MPLRASMRPSVCLISESTEQIQMAVDVCVCVCMHVCTPNSVEVVLFWFSPVSVQSAPHARLTSQFMSLTLLGGDCSAMSPCICGNFSVTFVMRDASVLCEGVSPAGSRGTKCIISISAA